MTRDNLLGQADKLLTDHASGKAVLEIHYQDEVSQAHIIAMVTCLLRWALDSAPHLSFIPWSHESYCALTLGCGVVTFALCQESHRVLAVCLSMCTVQWVCFQLHWDQVQSSP